MIEFINNPNAQLILTLANSSWYTAVWVFCTILGLAFIIVSVVLGGVVDHAEGIFSHDISFDHDGGYEDSVSIFQPLIIAIIITCYGATGLWFNGMFPGNLLLVEGCSILTGIFMGWLVFIGVLKPISKANCNKAVGNEELIGKIAVVTTEVAPGVYGKVVIVHDSQQFEFSAITNEDKIYKFGSPVTVIAFASSVAIVK